MTLPDETPKIPGSDQCEDHPLHRKAKQDAIDERAKHRPAMLHYRNCTIECPACHHKFNPNIKLTEDNES